MTEVRVHFQLRGRLQGVGFRPFIYNLAQEMELAGWIKNTFQGVELEIQGSQKQISLFEERLLKELPPSAQIRDLKKCSLPIEILPNKLILDKERFQIYPSETQGCPSADVLPDLAICKHCLEEIFNPSQRRYLYPFTHCIDCGPRYSILTKLPYDRENTTMSTFPMCASCTAEYHDPHNRRFHSQTNCCADCGPQYLLKDNHGAILGEKNTAVTQAILAIRNGLIVAVHGIGGFHLICDATNDTAINKLRQSKHRLTKPFAIMVRNLKQARELCEISPFEEILLQSKGAPIVLLRQKLNSSTSVSSRVAPNLPLLGIMLPYSPIHALFMSELHHPIVATSGNISEEPICYDPNDALLRLNQIADLFLIHNRRIASRIDDSVVREIAGTEVVLRAGRGYTPWVIEYDSPTNIPKETLIGLGGHQKNTVSIGHKEHIVLMPHLGNLDTAEATHSYHHFLESTLNFYQLSHQNKYVSDLHPHYRTTEVGQALDPSLFQIQHHEAHLLSCVAEHQLRGKIFGVAWDGTGYGTDSSLWGGEFFVGTERGFSRAGSFRPFLLPGGSRAIKDIKRTALGLLFEIFGPIQLREIENLSILKSLGFDDRDIPILIKLMQQKVNAPLTSSVGRLFDGIAALSGLCSFADYEGQAALELESNVDLKSNLLCSGIEPYPVRIRGEDFFTVDWEPWIIKILQDKKNGASSERVAVQFHRTLVEVILLMARRIGISQVVLSGGCFQNKILSEWTIHSLMESGFIPFWNQKIPPNDGGISVGQVMGGLNVSFDTR